MTKTELYWLVNNNSSTDMAWRVTLYLQKYWKPNSGRVRTPDGQHVLFQLKQQLKAPGCIDQDMGGNCRVNLSVTDFFWATTFATVCVVSSGVSSRHSPFGFCAAAGRAGLLSAASGGSLLAAVAGNRKQDTSEVWLKQRSSQPVSQWLSRWGNSSITFPPPPRFIQPGQTVNSTQKWRGAFCLGSLAHEATSCVSSSLNN